MTRQIPWLRVTIEGVVIVGSILLAFGIDAWWGARQDRDVEEAHLEALHADLTESLRLLEISNGEFERIRASLVSLLSTELEREPVDSVAVWIGHGLFYLEEYEPRMTALADLAASDQLRLLAPEVRRQVSEVDRSLNNLTRYQNDLRNGQEGIIDPFIVANVPLAWALDRTRGDLPYSEPLAGAPDWSPLQSAEARNRMVMKLTLAQTALLNRGRLQQEFETLKALIEERQAELR